MTIPEEQTDGNPEKTEDGYREMDTIKIRKIPHEKDATSEASKGDVSSSSGKDGGADDVKPAGQKRKLVTRKSKSQAVSVTPVNEPAVSDSQDSQKETTSIEAGSDREGEPDQGGGRAAAEEPSTPPKRPKITLKRPAKPSPPPSEESPGPQQAAEQKTEPQAGAERQSAAASTSEAPAKAVSDADQTEKPSSSQPAPPVNKKPELQKRDSYTNLPSHLKEPPPPPKESTGKKKTGKDNISQGRRQAEKSLRASRRLAPLIAWFMIVAGTALNMWPAWKGWINQNAFPRSELIFLVFTAVVMALLILPRKIVLRIIAAILTLFLTASCVLFMFLPAFVSSVTPNAETAAIIRAQLPSVELLAGSGAVLFGGFILLTGGTIVQWVLAILFVLIGAALPWLPLSESIPLFKGHGQGIVYESLKITIPSQWRPSAETKGAGMHYTLSGAEDLTLAIRQRQDVTEKTLPEQAVAIQKEIKDAYPDSGHFLDRLPDVPHEQRISVFGETRIDILVIRREQSVYEIRVAGPRATFDANEKLIDQTLAAF